MGSKYAMWFKNYQHFHYMLTNGQIDSFSDYSADPQGRAIPVNT